MSVTVRRFATPAALAAAAAAQFCAAATKAVAARGRFCAVLPGGRTPAVLYRALREAPWVDTVPWQASHFFLSDERCVPPEDHGSNFGLAQREFFSRVPLPPAQAHHVPVAAGAPDAIAEAWERRLRAFFGGQLRFPQFDLAVLGTGADGHTASLFPGDAALDAEARGAPAVARVTLTLPVSQHARAAMFLAAGSDKRAVIAAIETRATDAGMAYPAARVRPHGGTLWLYSETDL